jgi:hypothetical protein
MGLGGTATRLGRTFAAGALILSGSVLPAYADVLHAIYNVSIIGLPVGVAKVTANITPTSYAVDANARIAGIAAMVSNSRGASTGKGAIVSGHVVPASFATTASNAYMTRTIRMALSGNAVSGVDIQPPIEEKPDRVPLSDKDKRGVVDPVGAFIFHTPAGVPPTSAAACDRTIPVFDGYTRFDVNLSYVGQRKVSVKGYSGPVAVCAVRYVPIAGHRRDRPATKFMAENKDIEVWLAPIGAENVLMPFRISLRTMIGTAVAEASEFSIDEK